MRLEEEGYAPIIPLSPVPMWVMPQPKVDFSLLERRQKEGSCDTEVYDVREYMGSRSRYGEYAYFHRCFKRSKNRSCGLCIRNTKVKSE